MYKVRAKVEITEEYVLSRVRQEEIFEYYLKIPVQTTKEFCAPATIREDKNPSCRFFYGQDGYLLFMDFAGPFSGNCFNLVRYLFNIKWRKQAVKKIAKDFNLIDDYGYSNNAIIPTIDPSETLSEFRGKADFKIKRRNFAPVDKRYWLNQYGIQGKTLLKFQVIPISIYWINGKPRGWHSKESPLYAYRFGKGDYKFYQPLENKKNKFKCNSQAIQGYKQLPETGEILVITKSLKDVMVLYEFGIPSIAPQAEGNNLDPELIEELKTRFKHIVSFYDFDYAGIKGANKAKREFGIEPFFLTNGRLKTVDFKAKDISDYRLFFGHENTQNIIEKAVIAIKNNKNIRLKQWEKL